MFKKLILVLSLCSLTAVSLASGTDDEKMVRAVVKQYVDGTYEANEGKLRAAFWPSATMNGYLAGQLVEGTPELFFGDVLSKPSLKSSGADFKGDIEYVSVTGNVATAVLRETGFGPFNFTDYLQLMKKEGEWKIISKTFTTH